MRATRTTVLLGGVILGVLAASAWACTPSDEGTPGDGTDGGPDTAPTSTGTNEAGGPDSGKPSDNDAGPLEEGVVREIAYRQITNVAAGNPLPSVPVISADGKHVAFTTHAGGSDPNKVYTVDIDGSNLKEVDSYVPLCSCNSIVAISDDGSTIVSSAAEEVRVVDATGTLKGSVLLNSNEIVNLALSSDGKRVFFLNRRDDANVNGGLPVQRGTYAFDSTCLNCTAITQVLSPARVMGLFGKTNPDDVFPFAGCGTSLSVSGDGKKVFTVIEVAGVGQAVIAAGDDTTTTPTIVAQPTAGYKLVFAAAVSRDGTTLASWYDNGTTGTDVVVSGADGSNKKVLWQTGDGVGCGSPFGISNDGKQVSVGFAAKVFPSDGSTHWTLLARTGSFSGDPYFIGDEDGANSRDTSMSGDGSSFVFLQNDGVAGRQIGSAILAGADALKVASKVSAPKTSAATVPPDGKTTVTVSAEATGTPLRVSTQSFTNGIVESSKVHGELVLQRDGGAGPYSASDLYANTDAPPGPRTLRIKAESKDPSGLRTAHAKDITFSVK